MKFLITLPMTFAILVIFLLTGVSVTADQSYTTAVDTFVITSKFKKEMVEAVAGQGREEAVTGKEPFSVQYLLADAYRFEIIDSSVLIDRNGVTIAADRLRVPCKATVEYQRLPNGINNLLTLRVSQVLSPSTEEWTQPLPD